jgi:hypothetical protein
VVLKTTALASGYPVMDDAEGWGRLNLFAQPMAMPPSRAMW